ncbi:glycosyltransferase [uncultured Halomonas sp.]|uniref:glycosyltransferase family 2 protein n=1 Tax=uncultured Halomonas sp. TaxID=173971 RepID=UPI002631C4B2|nr:glycosyltransferase [uncultured Halomonas sp.]
MIHTSLVTVLLPTYHDWAGVKACLGGLDRQQLPAECLELLVVNNAPDDAPPSDWCLPGNARLLMEANPGSYAARNCGIAHARGDVLAFLDADCLPEPGWLEAALACMETHGADLVAGDIQLTYQSSKLTPAECYEKAFAFRQAQNVERGVAVTANLVVRREAFDAVGVFNERMMSGGDFEWTRRAAAAGFKLVYCPNAVVRHPARNTLSSLAQKARRVSAGSMALHGEKGAFQGGGRVLGNLGHDLRELLGRRDMTWRERGWALGVLIYLKGVKLRQRLAMRFGYRQAGELPR